MNTNICPKCNTIFDQSKKFCGKCGVPLVTGAVIPVVQEVPPQEITYVSQPDAHASAPSAKTNSTAKWFFSVVAGVLCLAALIMYFSRKDDYVPPVTFIDASKLVQKYYGSRYHIATDKEVGWDASTLEQLIKPQRAKKLTFPYLVVGDFNGDGKTPDYACFIINPDNKSDKKLVIFHNGDSKPNDVGNVIPDGIDFVPKQKIKSHWESYTLNMKGDGISVFKFESASRLFYWNSKKYSYYQLTD